jgi:hypothetical protein
VTWTRGRDITRREWIDAALAAEAAGRGVTPLELRAALDTAPAHARANVGKLREGGFLVGDETGLRVGPAGRALAELPSLLYLALDAAVGPGDLVVDFARRLCREVATFGLLVSPLMPSTDVLDQYRAGDTRALAVMVALAQRADIVLVTGRDRLALENRADVLAAERRGVPVAAAFDEVDHPRNPVAAILTVGGRRP